MGSVVLLDLMGGVALLLWGLHMVHSGILRAFGPDLRQLLGKGPEQPLHRLRGGHRPHRAVAEQHRNRPDHQFLYRRRPGRPGAGARDHARRQCRHHADRADPVVQHRAGGAGAVPHRPGRLPQRRALAHQGYRPRLHRPRPDAAGAAYPARYAGARRERPGHAGVHERHHRRSRALHPDRRHRHLGGAFQRRQRSAGDVAGLRAVHHALCGAGAGARRQSRQRHQSAVRRRPPRQSRQLPAPGRQSRQPAGRRAAGGAVPAADHRNPAGLAARPRQDDRRDFTSRSMWRPPSSSSACSTAWRGF